MEKQEIEKAIKNGKSVWVGLCDKINLNRYLIELKSNMLASIETTNELGMIVNTDIGEWEITIAGFVEITPFQIQNGLKWGFSLFDIYSNKEKAKHFAYHKNISRTEQLPFLTWEEFLEEKEIKFNSKKSEYLMIYLAGNITIYQCYYDDNGFKLELRIFDEEATEENFYKAYDECVELFKQE